MDAVWAALRDVGALHTRLVPGFVVHTKLEPGARIVTFGNGMVVRELIVDINDEAMRVAWSVQSESRTAMRPSCFESWASRGTRVKLFLRWHRVC